MKVRTRITLVADGEEFPPETLIDIEDGEAKGLIARGFAEEYRKISPLRRRQPSPASEIETRKPELASEDTGQQEQNTDLLPEEESWDGE